MTCKNYKTRTKNYKKIGYCTKFKKEVPLFCKCECVEYKMHNDCKNKDRKIKKCTKNLKYCAKSKGLAKLERKRFSILVSSTICCVCNSKTNLTWHEVFCGKNRANSMKYGLCLRLCLNCHEKYQEDKEFNDYWHKQAQIVFIKNYPNLDFLSIFRKNYL